MFLFSKLVWVFGQPLSLAFLFVLLAVLAGLVRWRATSLASSTIAGLILFATLYTTLGNFLLEGLEDRFLKPQDPADLQCMIVLGGAFENEVNTARHGVELNAGADRLVEALRLAQKYPLARILISGGDGSISGIYEGDAVISARFFPMFGIGQERLLEETTSRTTFENAMNTKELLASQGLSNCLLITSGYHMPRSVGIFRKLGIDVVPWPTDYRTEGQESLGLDFTQPNRNSQNLATAIREWFGLVGYYLAGRTSELYPG
ncbi:YdcF family protein [Rhizobium mesoamericanum]|uniref:Putative transmembrane protein n=1 Tax=Rhizobium mesoamericanum STM3625 TaxID=1211777 RepID=K0PN92_9HYPH|nr:YdcF family protein [Rhizobium mesoamericanum]CCM77996.1 putative transmembrane protein [Rhizobium mesoamericanum STM3625]